MCFPAIRGNMSHHAGQYEPRRKTHRVSGSVSDAHYLRSVLKLLSEFDALQQLAGLLCLFSPLPRRHLGCSVANFFHSDCRL